MDGRGLLCAGSRHDRAVLVFPGTDHQTLTLVLSASYSDRIPGREGELLMESLERTFQNYASQPGGYMGDPEAYES